MSKNTQQAIGLGLLGIAVVGFLGGIAQNRKISPNLRFIAQTAEGQLVQDLETGLIHLLLV
jgi:hypothetical protein